MIGIILDEIDFDLDLFVAQDEERAADRHLADLTGLKAAANDDALGSAPFLERQEAADDRRELLGKVLDDALDEARLLVIVAGQAAW